VIVFEPTKAVLEAVMVMVVVPVVLGGLNDAVIPLLRPLTEKDTASSKPLRPVTVIVLLWLLPWTTLNLLGESANEKSGGVGTVKTTVVVWTRPPEVPVTVSVAVPRAAQLWLVTVSVLPVVVVAGLKAADTPEGRPLTDRFTAPLNPLRSDTAIMLVPLLPRATVRAFAVADKE